MSNNMFSHSDADRSSSTEGSGKESKSEKKEPWSQRFMIRFFDYPMRNTTESQDIEVRLELDDNKNEHQIREQLMEKVPQLAGKRFDFCTMDIHTNLYLCPCCFNCSDRHHKIKEWNGSNIRKCTRKDRRRVLVNCKPAYSDDPASVARNLNHSPSLPTNVKEHVVQHPIQVNSPAVDKTRRAVNNNVSNQDQNVNTPHFDTEQGHHTCAYGMWHADGIFREPKALINMAPHPDCQGMVLGREYTVQSFQHQSQADDQRNSGDSAFSQYGGSTTTKVDITDNFFSEEYQCSPSTDSPMEILEFWDENPRKTGRKPPVIIKSITPESCDVKGGKLLYVELEAALSEWNIHGSVKGQFGNSDPVYPVMIDGLHYKLIIPRSLVSGIVPFVLLQESAVISNSVDFKYTDEQQKTEEVLVAVYDSQGNEGLNNFVKVFSTLKSKRDTNKRGGKGCKGPVDTVMELSVLRTIMEIAAKMNNMELFTVIFSTPVATSVFKSFKDNETTLDGVATEYGHHELAEFLAEKHLMYKDFESDSDNEVNWYAVAKALGKHQSGESDSINSSSSSYGFDGDAENSSSITSEISDVNSSTKEPCLEQEAALDINENHENSHPSPAYISQAPIVRFGKFVTNVVHRVIRRDGECDNISSNKLAPAKSYPVIFNYRTVSEEIEMMGLRETSAAFFRKDLFIYRSMMETNTLKRLKDQDVLTNLRMRTSSDRAINYAESSDKMPFLCELKDEVDAGSSYTKRGELNLQHIEVGVEVTCEPVSHPQMSEYKIQRVRASSDSRLLKNKSKISIEGVDKASVSEPTLPTAVVSITDEDTTNREDLFSEEHEEPELFGRRKSVLSFLTQYRCVIASLLLTTALLSIMTISIIVFRSKASTVGGNGPHNTPVLIVRTDQKSSKHQNATESPGEVKKCPPGTYVENARCKACKNGTYSSQYDATICSNCDKCIGKHNWVVRPCTSTSNTRCMCKPGYYSQNTFFCIKCKPCGIGKGVIKNCTNVTETVCGRCEKGKTFSNQEDFNACTPCTPNCPEYFKIKAKCTAKNDTECIPERGLVARHRSGETFAEPPPSVTTTTRTPNTNEIVVFARDDPLLPAPPNEDGKKNEDNPHEEEGESAGNNKIEESKEGQESDSEDRQESDSEDGQESDSEDGQESDSEDGQESGSEDGQESDSEDGQESEVKVGGDDENKEGEAPRNEDENKHEDNPHEAEGASAGQTKSEENKEGQESDSENGQISEGEVGGDDENKEGEDKRPDGQRTLPKKKREKLKRTIN